MPIAPRPGEQYIIRRKILKIFGAAFHVYGPDGSVVAYCKQKALKLREDLRLYTDETASQELLSMRTRHVIDFGATYDIEVAGVGTIAQLRRKGLSSTFVRDAWLVYNEEGREIATITERGAMLSFFRRYLEFIALFAPQQFDVVRTADGSPLASFRQHFNPFVYRLSVSILADDPELDELALLAAGCLLAAIEGRQG